MNEYYGISNHSDYFMHYGIKGMKWGIRKAVEKIGRMPHSKGYKNAQEKLIKATKYGGIIGGMGYLATHKDQLKTSSKVMTNKHGKKNKQNVKLNRRDKEFLDGMNKSTRKAGFLGGSIGGGIATARYIKQHPQQYASFKKKYKQMGFKDRMKVSYGRY